MFIKKLLFFNQKKKNYCLDLDSKFSPGVSCKCCNISFFFFFSFIYSFLAIKIKNKITF